MQVTPEFEEKVADVWGKPYEVAHAAIDELFRHDKFLNLDYEEQIDYALRVGVLAGELKDGNPETFIQRFEKEILTTDN